MEKKFRGKRIDNGEWAYGHLITAKYEDVDAAAILLIAHNPTTGFSLHKFFDVLPETVGQFTGLKDSKGVEIYEGDRVKFIALEDERKAHKSEATGVIEWDSEDAGFYILNDSDKFPHVKFWFAENIEVIGNIHQHSNPL